MSDSAEHFYKFGEFFLNPTERLLLRNGKIVPLTPKAIETLIVLVERNGHVVRKDELLDAVWENTFVEENSLMRNISALRKALGKGDCGQCFIETIPKVGYRFVAQVRVTDREDETSEFERPRADYPPVPVIENSGSKPTWLVALLLIAGAAFLILSFTNSKVRRENTVSDGNASRAGSVTRLTDNPDNDEYPAWTSDGRIRFINRGKNKPIESWVMDPDGGNKTQIKEIPDLAIGFWSPDGSKVVFGKKNDRAMFLASADGRDEKRLPFFFAANLEWSPDGTRIVFQSEQQLYTPDTPRNAEIYVYTLVTNEFVNITDHPSFDGDPSWSPDGTQIVFNSARDGNLEIYLMNADGREVRRLTDNPAWDSFPAFSPDGTLISFNSERDNEDVDIYVMKTDGTVLARLTDWESNDAARPGAWSPDGTKLAFISDRTGNQDIYVMDVDPFRPQLVLADPKSQIKMAKFSSDGSRIVYQAELENKTGELRIYYPEDKKNRVVIKNPKADLNPAFSPDGLKIAFQNKVDGQTEIFVIDQDGSNPRNLTNNPAKDLCPEWSPGGDKLVFSSNRGRDLGRFRIFTMNVDGSEQQTITPEESYEFDAVWSPDGSRIAFSCDREFSVEFAMDLCLVDLDGSNERTLLNRPKPDIHPAWSPDGSTLAFVAHSDGNPEIYTLNVETGRLLRVTRNLADDISPNWSPDGRRIIFSSNRGGRFALYQLEMP